jgi:hypothetical protein
VELWIILVLFALLFLSPVVKQCPQSGPGVSVIPGRTRRSVSGRRRTCRFPVAAQRATLGASCLSIATLSFIRVYTIAAQQLNDNLVWIDQHAEREQESSRSTKMQLVGLFFIFRDSTRFSIFGVELGLVAVVGFCAGLDVESGIS